MQYREYPGPGRVVHRWHVARGVMGWLSGINQRGLCLIMVTGMHVPAWSVGLPMCKVAFPLSPPLSLPLVFRQLEPSSFLRPCQSVLLSAIFLAFVNMSST
jgi:hypothetical protein